MRIGSILKSDSLYTKSLLAGSQDTYVQFDCQGFPNSDRHEVRARRLAVGLCFGRVLLLGRFRSRKIVDVDLVGVLFELRIST